MSKAKTAGFDGDDWGKILAVLGAVHTFVRNHGTARVLLERAVALDPNAAWAWSRLGWLDNYSDRPERAVEKAVKGMLPKNTLGRKTLTKLKVYAGPDHPHQAQQPQPYEIRQISQ